MPNKVLDFRPRKILIYNISYDLSKNLRKQFEPVIIKYLERCSSARS